MTGPIVEVIPRVQIDLGPRAASVEDLAGALHHSAVVSHVIDVQPVDPLEEWENPPFEPRRKGNNLYARGASDMKGQILASLNALQAIRQASVRPEDLPINFKFLFEGEEEIGSPNLNEFIKSHRDILASDLCLNADTGMLSPQLPTITYALRGLAYF